MRFLNHYRCTRCETEWEDKRVCACDDRCPNCDTPHSSCESEDLEEGDE